MRRKLLAALLGSALLTGSMLPTAAYAHHEEDHPGIQTRSELVKAARDFWSFTEANWSMMGFSSAAASRATLGGEWWGQTARTLGIQMTGSAVTRDPCLVTARQGAESEAGAQMLPAGQCR